MKPIINFTWIGGPTFLLQIGSFRLLTDPIFAEGANAFIMNGHPSTGEDNVPIARTVPLPPLYLHNLDLILISHLHSDHFDQAASKMLPKDRLLIVPTDHVHSPKLQDFPNRSAFHWWQETVLEQGIETLRITALPAHHSHNPVTNEELGAVNGYALQYTVSGYNYTIYWTGDTVWFDGIHEIKERLGEVHLLVPHMGAVGKDGPWGLMTLDSKEAVQVVDTIQPENVIPIHHHTFSHYTEPIALLEQELSNSSCKLWVLEEGQSVELWAKAARIPEVQEF